jgi:hypothetical protein
VAVPFFTYAKSMLFTAHLAYLKIFTYAKSLFFIPHLAYLKMKIVHVSIRRNILN